MIKIAFYSHVIDFAGTWRSHERIIEKLQNDDRFKTYVLYAKNINHNRLEKSKEILHNCTFLPFERSLEKTNSNLGYSPLSSNIGDVVRENEIDILHFARSGYYEWPFNQRIAPIQIETNIFGYRDKSEFLDGSVVIAKCLGISEDDKHVIIPNPIPPSRTPSVKTKGMKIDLGISKDTIVFGRIGRPDNFTPISLLAFDEFRRHVASKYLIVGACDNAKMMIEKLKLQDDVMTFDCTNDDEWIEQFHDTIDIFAHYRSDGEICSTAISQAMMCGIPVITHFAGQNGQAEWLGEGGFCVSDANEYLQAMFALKQNEIRDKMSVNAKEFAIRNFDHNTVVNRLIEFYLRPQRERHEISDSTREG